MSIRTCDGTDPNLTRVVMPGDLQPGDIIAPWHVTAKEGTVIIQCRCGLEFDDVNLQVIYPHNFIGLTTDPFEVTT